MRRKRPSFLALSYACTGAVAAVLLVVAAMCAFAQDAQESAKQPPTAPRLPVPKGAVRLSPKDAVWIDPKEKAILIDGQISLREGMLEMFACLRNTKEHESIVSANTKAYLVHVGLLRLGAEPGSPVGYVQRYVPPCGVWFLDIGVESMGALIPLVYVPPSGTEIEVQVRWIDERGKERVARAQDWVKNIQTGKSMPHPFVFAGSSFYTHPKTGKQYYEAEGGDFICVSNFSTAMLDIPVESSQANSELPFEAFTERIPPLGAPVRLVLKPKLKQDDR